MTEPELDDLDVDLDAEVPCLIDQCTTPATWRAVIRCPCGQHVVSTACHPHQLSIRYNLTLARVAWMPACKACQRPWMAMHITWTRL